MSFQSRVSSSALVAAASFALVSLLPVAGARADEARLRVTPQLEVSQSYDSDEVSVDDGERSGRIFEAKPRVKVEGGVGNLAFTATAGTRSRSNSVDSDLNATDELGDLELEYAFSPRFTAIARGTYRDRKRVDAFDADRAGLDAGTGIEAVSGRPDRRDQAGQLALQYMVDEKSTMQLAFSAVARDYSGDDNLFARDRSFNLNRAELFYQRALTPRDAISLRAGYSTIVFDAPGLSLMTEQKDRLGVVGVGWTRRINPMWTATLRAGVSLLRTRDDGIAGLSGPSFGNGSVDERRTGFDGGLELVRETEMSRTELSFTQDTRPSGGMGTSIDSQIFRLQHRQSLTKTLTFRLNASYQIAESASDRVSLTNEVPVALDPGLGGIMLLGCVTPDVQGSFRFTSDRLGAQPACVGSFSSEVDDRLFFGSATLDWQMYKGLITFLSVDYRDQDRDGESFLFGRSGGGAFGRDRSSTRVQLGIRYAYDIDLF